MTAESSVKKTCQTLDLNVLRYFVGVADGVTAKGPHTQD